MNSDEYAQCAKWLHEGRLLIHGKITCLMPMPKADFSCFSSRPDEPKMPNEVWVSPKTHECHMGVYLDKCGEDQVRYIRSGAAISGEKIEYRRRQRLSEWASSGYDVEYRFKP